MSKLRIKVSSKVLRVAGQWFNAEVAKQPSLKERFRPEAFKFMSKLQRRTASYIEMDRMEAVMFVTAWRSAIPSENFFAFDSKTDAPKSGVEAVVQLVIAIAGTLRGAEGQPPKIDPVEAWEEHAKFKASKRVVRKNTRERLLEHFEVHSVKGLNEALRNGKATAAAVRLAMNSLPPGTEPMFVLTDPRSSENSGVVLAASKDIAGVIKDISSKDVE